MVGRGTERGSGCARQQAAGAAATAPSSFPTPVRQRGVHYLANVLAPLMAGERRQQAEERRRLAQVTPSG